MQVLLIGSLTSVAVSMVSAIKKTFPLKMDNTKLVDNLIIFLVQKIQNFSQIFFQIQMGEVTAVSECSESVNGDMTQFQGALMIEYMNNYDYKVVVHLMLDGLVMFQNFGTSGLGDMVFCPQLPETNYQTVVIVCFMLHLESN